MGTLGGHYEIQAKLGEGGFGITYLAKDLHLPDHDLRVVKQFKPNLTDPASLGIAKDLFDREAKTLNQLGKSHDCIPRLHAHFQEAGEFYLVQDYVVGHPLSQEIQLGKPWPAKRVIQLLADILTPLAYVHDQGVIHRGITCTG